MINTLVKTITTAPKPRKVILIFGEPGSGKSYLAERLRDEYGYNSIISLDTIYMEFITNKYPSLYLPDLAIVISQHYKTILGDSGKKAWKKYAVSFIKSVVKSGGKIVIEGYLLFDILEDVRAKLSGMAEVSPL